MLSKMHNIADFDPVLYGGIGTFKDEPNKQELRWYQ